MIKPQDHRPDIELRVMLPAALLGRLVSYAETLQDGDGRASEVGYVIRAILDKELPPMSEPKAKANAKARRAGA